MSKHIPISEQANVPGGLMSFDPGTVPGQRPPNFGKQKYSRLGQLLDMSPKFATAADRRAWEYDFMAFGSAVVDEHGKHVPLAVLQPARR